MRKVVLVLLAIVLCISFCSCGEESISEEKGDWALFEDYDYSSNVIQKGSEYSFGANKWDMYVATAISDELVRVVKWEKPSSDKAKYEEEKEIGVFNITDPEVCFIWIDEHHTSFYINLQDTSSDKLHTGKTVPFTVLTTEGDNNKGTNYDENSISYLYKYDEDDTYWYRAIPLSDKLIKIEVWRFFEGFLWDTLIYGYDTLVIDLEKTTTDFAWTDDEHTSFSITMTDVENGNNWTEEKLVYFIVENEELLKKENVTENNTNEDDGTQSSKEETEIDDAPKDESSEVTKTSVYYSTNTRDVVDDGNKGVYSYKSKGSEYDIYWIIDFDEGYVYYFTDGNGNEVCDRLKIDSGDLNTNVKITYHVGEDAWSYYLHFKYVDNPEHLIMNDNDGFDYDYYPTNLGDAFKLRNTKEIKDY